MNNKIASREEAQEKLLRTMPRKKIGNQDHCAKKTGLDKVATFFIVVDMDNKRPGLFFFLVLFGGVCV